MQRTLGTLVLILVLAGCGSSTAGPETATDTPVESTTEAPATTTAAPPTTTAAPTTTAPVMPLEYAITDEYSSVWVLDQPLLWLNGEPLSEGYCSWIGGGWVAFGSGDEPYHCWERSSLPPAPGPPQTPWSLPATPSDDGGELPLRTLAVANWNFVSLVTVGADPGSASVVPWVTLDRHIYDLRVAADGSLVAVHYAECPASNQDASSFCQAVHVYRPDGAPPTLLVHEDASLLDVAMVDGDESVVFSAWSEIDEEWEWWIAPLQDPVTGERVVTDLPETFAVLTWQWQSENDQFATWGPDETGRGTTSLPEVAARICVQPPVRPPRAPR